MELTPKRMQLIIIGAVVFIAVGVIILLSVGGRNSIPGLPGSTSLRSFSGTGDQGVTDSADPCGLLSRSAVEAELGIPVADPQGGYVENPLGERFCRYPDPEDISEDLVYISIVFNESINPGLLNDGYNVQRMFEGRKASPELIEAVTGVGDDAFWGGSGDELWNGLHILIHDIYVKVAVATGDEELDYRAARNLAVITLERIYGP